MNRMKVWLKKKKCFKWVINVNCLSETFDVSDDELGLDISTVKWKNCDLLLNTGFKDSSGQYIYRYDIIENEDENLLVLGGLEEWGLFVERQHPFKYVTVLRQESLVKKKIIGNKYDN